MRKGRHNRKTAKHRASSILATVAVNLADYRAKDHSLTPQPGWARPSNFQQSPKERFHDPKGGLLTSKHVDRPIIEPLARVLTFLPKDAKHPLGQIRVTLMKPEPVSVRRFARFSKD